MSSYPTGVRHMLHLLKSSFLFFPLYFPKWSNKKQTEILSVLRGSEAPSGNMIPVSTPCNTLVWWCGCGALSAPCRKCVVRRMLSSRALSYFSSNESPWCFHQKPPTAATVEKECWREAEPALLCRPHVTSPLLPLVFTEGFLSVAAQDCYNHSSFTEKQSLLWKSHTNANNQALLIR